MASSLVACLHSVGFEMPRVHGVDDVVPLLDVDGVVEALTEQVMAVYIVLEQSPLKGLFHANTSSGLSLIAHVGGIVNFLLEAHAANFALYN